MAPPSTTTTTARTQTCRPDPFPRAVADDLAERYRGKLLTAHVYDTRTGCSYSLNPDNQQRSASVFKVLVMAGTLFEAQQADREVTDRELALMTPMITRSTNNEVRILWRAFGGGDWFRQTADAYGIVDIDIVGDFNTSPWGRTRATSHEQVNLLRQVLLGEWGPLNEYSRGVALDLMTSVVPEQTWGVTAGVPEDWTVAQKNGFAGSIINSVGWVDEPGESDGYVIAILTEGWPNFATGIAAVEVISEIAARAMLLPLRTGSQELVE